MHDARSILAEVKTKRIEAAQLDACLTELRRPWHAPFWSLIAQVPWLVIAVVSIQGKRAVPLWAIGLVAALSFIAVLLQMRQRDRMWRELIAKKSPALARELYDVPRA